MVFAFSIHAARKFGTPPPTCYQVVNMYKCGIQKTYLNYPKIVTLLFILRTQSANKFPFDVYTGLKYYWYSSIILFLNYNILI